MSTLSPARGGAMNVPAVDGFRGLAVLWIVAGHCWNELGGRVPLDSGPLLHLFQTSYMGVDMLFVVSGFVLFLPCAVRGTLGDTRRYAVRRIARIVPGFYVFLLFSFIVAKAVDVKTPGAGAWLTHLLFLHAEANDVSTDVGFGVNGAMWTMSTEVWFYAFLPVVATWYRRRPLIGLGIAVVIAQFWHKATTELPTILDWAGIGWSETAQGQVRMALAFPSYIAHFAVGMTAAWLYVSYKTHPESERTANALVLWGAAIVGVVASVYLRQWHAANETSGPLDHWLQTTDRALFFGLLVLATALAPAIIQWPFRNTFSRLLGIVSYGMYLSHLPLIDLFQSRIAFDDATTNNGDLYKLLALVVPLVIVIGIVSYSAIEEPFRRLARRKERREQTAARAPRTPVAVGGVQA